MVGLEAITPKKQNYYLKELTIYNCTIQYGSIFSNHMLLMQIETCCNYTRHTRFQNFVQKMQHIDNYILIAC